jgi:hypothetical protein
LGNANFPAVVAGFSPRRAPAGAICAEVHRGPAPAFNACQISPPEALILPRLQLHASGGDISEALKGIVYRIMRAFTCGTGGDADDRRR